MPKRAQAPDFCMIARAMGVLGEQWTILILRDAFFGVRNFDAFQSNLGIARNVLSNRLSRLVAEGLLDRRPSETDRRKVEYRLTEKGRDLLPLILALTQWGSKWLRDPSEPWAFAMVDRETGARLAPIEARTVDGKPVSARDLRIVPGPGLTDAIRERIPALRDK